MLTFDSLKFAISLKFFKKIDYKKFDLIKTYKGNMLVLKDEYVFNGKIYGLKRLCVNNTSGKVLFELSAKILELNYAQNISHVNFMNILHIFEIERIYKFNEKFYLDCIEFYRTDLSKNIYLKEDIYFFINSFYYAMQSKNIAIQKYKNESLTFSISPTSKTRRLRGIFYDKYAELKKDKEIQKILDIDQFKNVLRYEITVNSFFLMKKYFEIKKDETLNYNKLFLCKTNIFLKIFDILIENYKTDTSTLKDIFSEKKLMDIEKFEGRKAICKKFNYDYTKICNFLKSKVKGNISAYLMEYRKILSHNGNDSNFSEVEKYIDKFRFLLTR